MPKFVVRVDFIVDSDEFIQPYAKPEYIPDTEEKAEAYIKEQLIDSEGGGDWDKDNVTITSVERLSDVSI